MSLALLGRLAAFSEMTVTGITPARMIDVAKAFGVNVDEGTATTITEVLPRFASSPEQTLVEFITEGNWLYLVANQEPKLKGDGLIRCPHCEELIFLR